MNPNTADLALGDVLVRSGRNVRVTDLEDTGRPAVFGTGTEWRVTYVNSDAAVTILAAATSQRWERAA